MLSIDPVTNLLLSAEKVIATVGEVALAKASFANCTALSASACCLSAPAFCASASFFAKSAFTNASLDSLASLAACCRGSSSFLYSPSATVTFLTASSKVFLAAPCCLFNSSRFFCVSAANLRFSVDTLASASARAFTLSAPDLAAAATLAAAAAALLAVLNTFCAALTWPSTVTTVASAAFCAACACFNALAAAAKAAPAALSFACACANSVFAVFAIFRFSEAALDDASFSSGFLFGSPAVFLEFSSATFAALSASVNFFRRSATAVLAAASSFSATAFAVIATLTAVFAFAALSSADLSCVCPRLSNLFFAAAAAAIFVFATLSLLVKSATGAFDASIAFLVTASASLAALSCSSKVFRMAS